MAPAAVPTGNASRLARLLQSARSLSGIESFARQIVDCLATAGTASNPHFDGLVGGKLAKPMQALADCAHFLAILHGQVPSLIELASSSGQQETGHWLRDATAAFNEDRRWLARLSVLTGGALDLAGLTAAEQSVRDQRDAMLTLATSSRAGCALGAAVALVIEWQRIRAGLPQVALDLGADCRDLMASEWPADGAEPALLRVGDDPKVRRAIVFGATQLSGMHGQLFDLLEARHASRIG